MKKNSFVYGTFMLLVSGIIVKVLGAVYKICLTNILGAEGMGIYYLIFPLYSFLIILSSSGISFAVSKLVSENRIKGEFCSVKQIFKTALAVVTILSTILSLLLILFSKYIAKFQGNEASFKGYVVIAPAIILSGILAVFRGYFQGHLNMFPTSLSNIVEQVFKMILGFILSVYFLKYGIKFSVLGAIFGVVISEFMAVVVISIQYYRYNKKLNKNRIYSPVKTEFKKWLKEILKISMPLTLSYCMLPIVAVIDSFMVINLITKLGYGINIATELYGINSGMIGAIINIPVMFIMALTTTMVPNLCCYLANGNNNKLIFNISFFIKIALIVSIPFFVMCVCCSSNIVVTFFGAGLNNGTINQIDFANKLLQISAINIITYSLLETICSVLQSLNKPYLPLVAMGIALIIRTLLVYLLTTYLNIFGVAIANTIFLIISLFICVIFLKKNCCLQFRMYNFVVSPLISGIIMFLIVDLTKTIFYSTQNNLLILLICSVVGIVSYCACLYIFKVFTKTEIECFKLKNKKVNKIKT